MSKRSRIATAEHRPAVKPRRFRHDELVAGDFFSGYGGLTNGIKAAGFTVIVAANHNAHKVEVHEANHPEVEHWIADLVDSDSPNYHSARDLPPVDLLVAGVSCTNHSGANSLKAYEQGLSLFDLDDPDFDARVTKSERDRATANCVLAYADEHHPRMILVECTTELQSWGPALPGRKSVGDGSTFRWWLKQHELLGYKYKILYLNSMFFGVPQSRDRLYIVFWDRKIPDPDLEHRPESWCTRCDRAVQARQSWRTGVPASGRVRYGEQYGYSCPSCRSTVVPPMAPSLHALDLTDLGTRIGDKPVKDYYDRKTKAYLGSGPLAPATMARAERCRAKFAEFPAVLMPAKAVHGVEKHPWQPMATQTSQQETSLLSTGSLIVAAGNSFERPGSECRSRGFDQPLWTQSATNGAGLVTPPIALAVDNYQGGPRGAGTPLPTQGGSETLAVVSSGVLPFRRNTLPAGHGESMPTVTADQIPGVLSAGATVGGWFKQNGSTGAETAPHPFTDALRTLTSRDTTGVLMAQWREALAELALEDCFFRMMAAHEVGRGCGFDVDFPNYRGSFVVWGTPRQQVDGYGNAVSPPVGEWIGGQLYPVLHSAKAA